MPSKIQALEKILLAKWEKKELAHFYHLSANEMIEDKAATLDRFLISFFGQVLNLKVVKKEVIRSHPDFFFLGDLEDDTNYKTEELNELMRFNELAPQILKHKFLVIYHAHLVTRDMFNKLLKLLEEPNKRTTIFLLNDRGIELLPTIRSRALQLKLPFEEGTKVISDHEHDLGPMLEDLLTQKLSLNQVLEKLKTVDGRSDEALSQAILSSALIQGAKLDYQKLQELSSILQCNIISQAFNNARAERLFQLLAFAQKSL
ncbi:MAG: hypothetical protein ACOYL6_08110 [Bacteriovoracaceae bacterium]